jgi:hypothetical protein
MSDYIVEVLEAFLQSKVHDLFVVCLELTSTSGGQSLPNELW